MDQTMKLDSEIANYKSENQVLLNTQAFVIPEYFVVFSCYGIPTPLNLFYSFHVRNQMTIR